MNLKRNDLNKEKSIPKDHVPYDTILQSYWNDKTIEKENWLMLTMGYNWRGWRGSWVWL